MRGAKKFIKNEKDQFDNFSFIIILPAFVILTGKKSKKLTLHNCPVLGMWNAHRTHSLALTDIFDGMTASILI